MARELTEEQKQKYLARGITHLLHVTDTFDYTDYTVEVKDDELFEEIREYYSGRNMQRVSGVTFIVDQADYDKNRDERVARVVRKKLNELLKAKGNQNELKLKLYNLGEKEAKEILRIFLEKTRMQPSETLAFTKPEGLAAEGVMSILKERLGLGEVRASRAVKKEFTEETEIGRETLSQNGQKFVQGWADEHGEDPRRIYVKKRIMIDETDSRCEIEVLGYFVEFSIDYIVSTYEMEHNDEIEFTKQTLRDIQRMLEPLGFNGFRAT